MLRHVIHYISRTWCRTDKVFFVTEEMLTKHRIHVIEQRADKHSRVLCGLTTDNYSSKFRRSELAWEIYFLSSRGSPRIFKGSRQMPRISTLSDDENPNFSRPAMFIAAFRVVRLFCTSPLKRDHATKTSVEPFPAIEATFAHTFSILDTLRRTAL